MEVKAQPTLTATNTNVVVGEQFMSNEFSFNASQFNASLVSGPNQTWNFSTLTSSFFPPISILFQPYLPTGGYNAFPTSDAVIGCDDEYEFLKTNNDSVMLVGFINHFTEELRQFSNPIKKLQYPFSFNNTFTDNFAGQYKSMSPWINFSGNLNVTADGYGTLILPGGTITNVLRVKSILIRTSFHPNFNNIDSITTLDWYLPGIHVPVLKIIKQKYSSPNYNATDYQGYYINPFALGSKEELASQFNLQTFPNPASSEVNVQFQTLEPTRITLHDLVGEKVAELYSGKGLVELQHIKIDVSKYPKGIYLLKLETEEKAIIRKLVLQ